MIIKVTQDHIRLGQQKSLGWCPVALAIRESLSLGENHPVHVDYVNIGIGGRENQLAPQRVVRFIREYDSARFVGPFEFEVDL